MNTNIFTMNNLYWLSNRKGEIETEPMEIPAKLDEPMAKRKPTFFHSGVEQVARFLEDGDDNDG